MRLSLRIRVLLFVFLANAVLFAVGGVFVLQVQTRASEEFESDFSRALLHTLKHTIRADSEVQVARILQWQSWELIEDALLVDRNLEDSTAGVRTRGVAINPVGRARRPADFDEEAVLAALRDAIEGGQPVPIAGGTAMPIAGPRGTWGGCWYRMTTRVDRGELFLTVLGWFAVSTLLLTLATFYTLRKLVLDPVEQLADGARRVRGGDLTVRIGEPARRDEVADLVRSFNAMTETVRGFNERLALEVETATAKARTAEAAAMTQRRLAAMGELAAGIAHEINNPLGGLQNAVQKLQQGDLSEAKRAEYLRLLAGGLERIGRTVSQLLRFTPRSMQTAAVDLVEVAGDAIDLVRHRAERLGVALELSPLDGSPGDELAPAEVQGARNELGQAVLNLLANALDALEDGGTEDPGGARVVVGVGRRNGSTVVRVSDNGPGVDKEALGRVSDLFYTTKEVGKGTGLGLALVHNTVASHGGRVTISSNPGRGFTVELSFP